MPWSSGAEFAHRHNKKLSGAAAGKAKDIANAIIRRGGDEGVAIATANKYGNKMQAKRRKPQPEQATHYDSTVANWGSLDGSETDG